MKIYIDDAYNTIYEILTDRDNLFYAKFIDKSHLLDILSNDFPCQFERAKINKKQNYLTIERKFNKADNYKD